ncbi:hypothetical protein [Chryseolinea soli]|uniref:YARHG domain-containing protein n=1 Tax=Chryseolinea soli TaxID=2321403 RepID=A0A385SNC2_9BACT|nr:hypothetical protein [Chryseolinea soli]AYB33283.1 hypothetical protein D4L85_23045 [Chryseolinea soli]
MKALFCFALLLLLFPFHAQGQPDQLYKLELRKEVHQMPWRDSVYRFAHFLPGKITFDNNFTPDQQVMLNYNTYFEHMYLVNKKGDTLQVKDYSLVKMVTIGEVNFINDPQHGYVEVVTRTPVALGIKHNFILLGEDMGIGKPPLLKTSTDFRGVRIDYTRVYRKGEEFYFIDINNATHKATLAVLNKLFPNYKEDIKTLVKARDLNFRRKEDLLTLLAFCNGKVASHPSDTTRLLLWKAHQPAASLWWRDSLRRFPSFMEGRITYRSQRTAASVDHLNYNLLTGEMESIGQAGDTSTLKNQQEIRSLFIDDFLYYHDAAKGYIEVLMQGPLSLGEHSRLKMINDELSAEARAGSAPTPYFVLKPGDRVYRKEVAYYLIDKDARVYPATKDVLIHSFYSQRNKIEDYLKANDVDFKNESDLRALLSFCYQLSAKK